MQCRTMRMRTVRAATIEPMYPIWMARFDSFACSTDFVILPENSRIYNLDDEITNSKVELQS